MGFSNPFFMLFERKSENFALRMPASRLARVIEKFGEGFQVELSCVNSECVMLSKVWGVGCKEKKRLGEREESIEILTAKL